MTSTEDPIYRLTTHVNREAIEAIRRVAKAERRSLGAQCAIVLQEYAAAQALAGPERVAA